MQICHWLYNAMKSANVVRQLHDSVIYLLLPIANLVEVNKAGHEFPPKGTRRHP
jgi:hypothetical protein